MVRMAAQKSSGEKTKRSDCLIILLTHHIHIKGLVQGVGFRPLVHRLGTAKNLRGFVCNDTDGVHIEINASEDDTRNFLEEIIHHKPVLAHILSYKIEKITDRDFVSFSISESNQTDNPQIPLTPDYAMCPACNKELHDPGNRRYQYPFITCTNCGPRYSIAHSLPFDREHTAMSEFAICPGCLKEYNDPANRRFYAQTNSCDHCGIECSFYQQGKLTAKGNNSAITTAVSFLKEGQIIAVKGIGGYLLLVDANNPIAITRLRTRKHRPFKPLAVLFNSVTDASQYAILDQRGRDALRSPASPIVLARIDFASEKQLAYAEIAPQLDTIGVMIPYAPLLQLISDQFEKPLIATSANLSQSPIIYKDEDALTLLNEIADGILTHNRKILVPQDDSVVSITTTGTSPIILRRSRGLSPSFPYYTPQKKETILALGASMKSSFALSNHQSVYISQFLGDTGSYDAQESYRSTLSHTLQLLQATPGAVITDLHPQYFSHELGKSLSKQHEKAFITVQHHKAHFAAVLAENELTDQQDVLGVIWDGTGLGDDNNIWGGEFFHYKNKQMHRVAHLSYFQYLLGDKMAKEPRISALAIAGKSAAADIIKNKFSGPVYTLYTKMLEQNNLLCSSMGRLFDTVACLLNLCDAQSYEGQAALQLETIATRYVKRNGYYFQKAYPLPVNNGAIQLEELIDGIVYDWQRSNNAGYIAAKFHYSLIKLIGTIASTQRLNKIAVSGGVFQNTLLRDMLTLYLGKTNELYFHKNLSPNDENISFGQLVYWDQNIDDPNR